jgi:hypothetical protein
MMKRLALLPLCAALAGCASASQQPVPLPGPIFCKAGTDCDAKWSRAVQWIASNSSYRIQVQTDNLIQTAGPLSDDPDLAYTVTKSAAHSGDYQILISSKCGNAMGCTRPPSVAIRDFTAVVAGSSR